MARLSSSAGSASVAANIQSELLARSGFQPYRPDERLAHPAGPFPLDAYSPFGGIPGLSPGEFYPSFTKKNIFKVHRKV